MLDIGQLLEIVHPDVPSLSEDEYALLRRQGLGASDASVFLGLQSKWKDTDMLIKEKVSPEITEEERAVGKKDVVRKGRDLEPMILTKAQTYFDNEITKPTAMYRLKEFPYLTINFDGVTLYKNQQIVPVECKYVSPYGDKYYDRTRAVYREYPSEKDVYDTELYPTTSRDVVDHCENMGAYYGIPAYYYAQVQQQIMGLGSDLGFLAALHDKGWELCIYQIPKDEFIAFQITLKGSRVWDRIENIRGRA